VGWRGARSEERGEERVILRKKREKNDESKRKRWGVMRAAKEFSLCLHRGGGGGEGGGGTKVPRGKILWTVKKTRMMTPKMGRACNRYFTTSHHISHTLRALFCEFLTC
jgi:hypothetical protein